MLLVYECTRFYNVDSFLILHENEKEPNEVSAYKFHLCHMYSDRDEVLFQISVQLMSS